jgi:sugar O-acyltransferase (sialic acid O-acetyltransferase NeuD family)
MSVGENETSGRRRAVVLAAASGLAREAAEALPAGAVRAVLDDDPARWGLPFAGARIEREIGPVAVQSLDGDVVVCAGKGRSRSAIVARLAPADPSYARIVHPSACVPRSASVGAGSILLAGVVLTADVSVGDHVVVMPNAVLTHDVVLADYATVCAGVNLAGGVVVGAGAYLGTGCLVREGVRIGAGAVVGMGAVVLSDVPAGATWVGNPARPLPVRVTT